MSIKKKWFAILWMCLALCLITLLVMAGKGRSQAACKDIKVELDGDNNVLFLDEASVKQIINDNGGAIGKQLSRVSLRKFETVLLANPSVENAKLFFDNDDNLNVKIKEREPIARVFTLSGNSFFVDSSCHKIPVNERVVVRLPVFTSFTSDKRKLSRPDSSLLADVKNIGEYIYRDTFWNSFISQVNILPDMTFEMIPIIGNSVIELGNADDLDGKFNRLYSFYKQIWANTGFNKYEKIDVRYSNQVVATKKGGALAQALDTTIHMGNDNPIVLKTENIVTHSSDTIKTINKKGFQPPAATNEAIVPASSKQKNKTTKNTHI